MPGHSLDHAGLETLPFALCLRLLASVPVGRVGFVADGEVQVLPVNHVLDGQDVVFRTAHGSKLSAAEGEKPVTFEVDDYDERTHSGWSVVVTGRRMKISEMFMSAWPPSRPPTWTSGSRPCCRAAGAAGRR